MSITSYKISIKGLNLHHIIDYLQNKNIYLTDVERISRKKLICTIPQTDYKKLKKAKISKKYKIKIEKRYGLEGYFRLLLRKVGLIIGVITMALTTINITSNIYSVKITSQNHNCQNGEHCIFNESNISKLYASLESFGIKEGAKISNVSSYQKIKQELMIEFSQISDVSIQRKGVIYYVNILEAKLPTNQVKTNLIAEESGIVIKTNVTSGNLKVKIGDIVLKGDILIENTGTPACGTVTLRSFFHQNTIFNEEQITYERTGRSQINNNLEFFSINIKSNQECNFSIYETEITNKYLTVNSLLPIKLKQTTFYELKKKESLVTFESEKEKLYNELEEKTKLLVPLNAEIKNTTFTQKQEGSRYLITCYIETYLTLSI